MNWLRSKITTPVPVVYMFQDDYERVIKTTVLQHLDCETGGDLFGLWSNEADSLNPLVHVVLGPGQGCERTEISFFQDVPYLRRVGESLADHYMLGHIGEWHSHHRLRLCDPSSGDHITIRKNYPSGFHGFVLIIANIVPNGDKVTLSPYLYRENTREPVRGKVKLIPGKSPFLRDGNIARAIRQGAEGTPGYTPRTSSTSNPSGNTTAQYTPPSTTITTQPVSGNAVGVYSGSTAVRYDLVVSSTTVTTQPMIAGNAVGVPSASAAVQYGTSTVSSTTAKTTPTAGSAVAGDKEAANGTKGIVNLALDEEDPHKGDPGVEGGPPPFSPDVVMSPDFWYRSEDRDKKLDDILAGTAWLTTQKDPFVLSFCVSGSIERKKAAEMLSKIQEVAGDEKITISCAFNREGKQMTVEIPADHPRTPATFQCLDPLAASQVKADIMKEDILDVFIEISRAFKPSGAEG